MKIFYGIALTVCLLGCSSLFGQSIVWDGSKIPTPFPGGVTIVDIPEAPIFHGHKVTAPGAGNDFSETVPSGEEWDLMSITFQYTADAQAGNRYVAITIEDAGGDIFAIAQCVTAQTANQMRWYSFWRGATELIGPSIYVLPLPDGLYIGPGCVVRSSVAGMKSGDTFTNIVFGSRQGDN